jgi:hypothetical protein
MTSRKTKAFPKREYGSKEVIHVSKSKTTNPVRNRAAIIPQADAKLEKRVR